MKMIGITGTIGAGKGTIVDYLLQKHGFLHFSVRKFLTELLEKKRLAPNRDNMVAVANELRAMHTPSYIAEQLYELAAASKKNSIIESIRTPGEVEALRKKGNFTLLAVDAFPRLRYERILSRNTSTDKVTFEEFLAQEEREMTATDPNHQNLSECIRLADFVVHNNGTREELYHQIEKALYGKNDFTR